MSVSKTAKRLAAACRQAMPCARVHLNHSRAPWGESSYVYVVYGENSEFCEKARVSDHGIDQRRYLEDHTSLYLAAGAKAPAWELWLADVTAKYARAGGRLPEPVGFFSEARA